MVDTSFSAIPRLQLPSITVYGAITPARAFARLSTLLQLIQELLRIPPSPVSIPILPLYTVLLSLIEAYVPLGRRSEEASINGIALSPHDQWLLLPSLYVVALQVVICTVLHTRPCNSQLLVFAATPSWRHSLWPEASASSSCAATRRTSWR